MSELQKKVSERKHKMVYKLLVEKFPGCEVKYDGVEGIDNKIFFNNKTTFVETKTCKRTIRAGVRFDENKPVLHQKVRLGRFKFDQRNVYPYELSQHGDLIKNNGWYIFVVGQWLLGAPAWSVDREIGGCWGLKRVCWARIAFICYPNWLEKLKIQVYGVGINE